MFDRYLEQSIKSATRDRRTGGSRANIYHIQPDSAISKDWTMFLSRAENKESLAKCYTDYFISEGPNKIRPQENIYLSGGKDTICHIVRPHDCLSDAIPEDCQCAELKSNKEEADTRIVLQAIYATNNGADRLVIQSPDTDVLVLLLYHRSIIPASEIIYIF